MATLSIRIDDDLKKETERNLQSMGLNFSSAINMYFAKVNQTKSIPFEITADEYGSAFYEQIDRDYASYDPASAKHYTSGEEALKDILGDGYAL